MNRLTTKNNRSEKGQIEVPHAIDTICKALCLLSAPSDDREAVLYDVSNGMTDLVQALGRLVRLSEDERQSIQVTVSEVSRTVRQSRKCVPPFYQILDVLTEIDRLLQEQGLQADADAVIGEAASLLNAMAAMEDRDDAMIVDGYVQLAKAHRWPAARTPQAHRLLAEARRFVEKELLLQNRVDHRALIASGYARLGDFQEARELATGARDECRLNLAIQMLINEYERVVVQGRETPAVTARILGRCWKLFDQPN